MIPCAFLKQAIVILALSVFLGGCADRWSEKSPSGLTFQEAEPICREQAQNSAKRQLPFYYDRDAGPAGTLAFTRVDIEKRETARCLLDKGFTLTRVWK